MTWCTLPALSQIRSPWCLPQLPYEQAGVGVDAADSELKILSLSAEVKDLRDTYVADLVVLVGLFAGLFLPRLGTSVTQAKAEAITGM